MALAVLLDRPTDSKSHQHGGVQTNLPSIVIIIIVGDVDYTAGLV